jgi:multidrug efflux pump subunit AcrA (membrane-fusion protein)
VDEVKVDDVSEVVDAPGTVVASATATVSATATGSVAQLMVSEGQRVAAGDVLAVIDSPQAQQQLAQAIDADQSLAVSPVVPDVSLGRDQRDARKAAAAAFDDARARAELITDPELRESTLLSIQTAQAQYELAIASSDAVADQLQAGVSALADAVTALSEAQRIQTRAAVTAAQQAVDALTIKAPISGTVSLTAAGAASGSGTPDLSGAAALLAGGGTPDLSSLTGGGGGPAVTGVLRVGQPVSSGQAVLTITDDSALSVAAQVDETDVLLVDDGTAATVVLDALPGDPIEAEVVSIDPSPTTSARGGVAFTVRVPLPDDVRPGLLPGMSAIVSLTVREAPGVPVVPTSAIVRRDGGDSVWRLDSDGKARLRPVDLGVLGDGIVEVVSGLEAGDRIVTSGADLVDDGDSLG